MFERGELLKWEIMCNEFQRRHYGCTSTHWTSSNCLSSNSYIIVMKKKIQIQHPFPLNNVQLSAFSLKGKEPQRRNKFKRWKMLMRQILKVGLTLPTPKFPKRFEKSSNKSWSNKFRWRRNKVEGDKECSYGWWSRRWARSTRVKRYRVR